MGDDFSRTDGGVHRKDPPRDAPEQGPVAEVRDARPMPIPEPPAALARVVGPHGRGAAAERRSSAPRLPPGSSNEFCWMDIKTHDVPGTAAFFAQTLGWRFAVDEDDWRKATKISVDDRLIGGVSDLANPIYPPGTPDHIAFYLAVDDVDRRVEAAVANGARLVVPPFEAGDQGRMATLIDPFGAAVSLWQARAFTGWKVPPGRMVLACAQPDDARRFYEEMAGAPLAHADFVAAPVAAPQWELVVAGSSVVRLPQT